MALCFSFLSADLFYSQGSSTSTLIGIGGLGFAAKLDIVSVTLLTLVSFVGWVVVRFAATYMDGEDRQGSIPGRLCMTLGTELLLGRPRWRH